MLSNSIFSKWINWRALVGMTLFCCLLIMLITSLLMFTQRHNSLIAMLHTIVGTSMLLMLVWHMFYNWAPLKNYFSLRNLGKQARSKLSMPVSIMAFSMLTLATLMNLPPFSSFYQWGMTLRSSDLAVQSNDISYLVLDRRQQGSNGLANLSVEFTAGAAFQWPQYAIWLETMDGKLVQPIYVTQKLADNRFDNRVAKRDQSVVFTHNPFEQQGYQLEDDFDLVVEPESRSSRFRTESLPVFLHKLAQYHGGQYIPENDTKLVADAYSGATMDSHFIYRSALNQPLSGQYRLRMELNQSFDFNEYYSSDRFPDDEIYSGSGFSAQPSIVYEAIIDLDSKDEFVSMKRVGRGHHSGRDGQIYTDLQGMTSALHLVDRVLVHVE
ncbi:DUF4405 domain-containing protein [Shewanella waksmanii]|uniref:DUF4405 domain-containing protein n=1 Tax=Shewanella waksmanii TaxID=213783 RepID=UPI0037351591